MSMPPNTLLMCKLLVFLLTIHGFLSDIGDPHIPFIPILDYFRGWPGLFKYSLLVTFAISGIALFLNIRVRTAAIILGLTVILYILASKPGYRNHILIVGCLLFLAGLHKSNENAWLIKYQFAVMYFGAFLNKCFNSDWHNGGFMHHWLHGHLKNPFYETLSPLLPDLWFATLLSWTVITCELLLAVLLFHPPWRKLGVWLMLAMHISFFIIVGRRPFGHFTEDILIALLVFLNWPRETMVLTVRGSFAQRLRPIFQWINWDSQFALDHNPNRDSTWITLKTDDRVMNNTRALGYFVQHSAGTYVYLFLAFNGIAYLSTL
jgi:hypothetical protein